ncbi:uncharacterized protein EI97DRAFT_401994 [Westerdykella ornata]|uniref:Uncharacterized protein n=1 Tax=Westerdykella ornata TaxID=318751 RepID=A0A6A6JDX3_WESOR|nr:uncharacterized protein EI97DRAFT_401994 [Westerdykella ornata]KAF2274487.1 hypothetical protein EI97DRAFT_401994 [Westerdykella ornata]
MNRGQHNADGRRQQPVSGPVNMFVRGIAAGIGLASETYQHHRKKKASNTRAGTNAENAAAVTQEARESQDDGHLSQQMDEAVWELDEAQDEVTDRPSRPSATEEELTGLADSFLLSHPQPPSDSAGQLALPVVITQRRPGSRTKGFVRAYSPLLADVGIDQTTFLDFLDKLNKAVAPSPWIQAINLAAFAGMAVPMPFSIAVSLAVKKVADAASELHSRSKTNLFLDRVNESFFAPRGLVALVMTWKPGQKDNMLTRAEFDMQSSIVEASSGSNRHHMFQSSSGASSFEWPATAPLVFPALDELADADDDGANAKKQSAVKRSTKFVGEYFDKRARAKWAGENPDSNLANARGQEEFSSRYADPNHPASSGDPIALLTGGSLQAGIGRQVGTDSRNDVRAGLLGRQSHMGLGRGRSIGWQRGGELSHGGGRGRIGGGIGGGIEGGIAGGIGPLSLITGARKLLQDDVLYLMIVQRPTEDEMAEAIEEMNALGQTYR